MDPSRCEDIVTPCCQLNHDCPWFAEGVKLRNYSMVFGKKPYLELLSQFTLVVVPSLVDKDLTADQDDHRIA
jgi:hypothetical protein